MGVDALAGLSRDPAGRPKIFRVGYDVYDETPVGFVSTGEAAGRLFDMALPRNANTGHRYGTGLLEGDKRALVEFLKTQ